VRVFISYRRADSPGHALTLSDSLTEATVAGEACETFLDVDKIAPGRDFIEVMTRSMESCDVAVAVIGRHWLVTEGQLRLTDPADFVRSELRTAVITTTPIVAVLVDGATQPSEADVPDDIAAVAAAPSVRLEDDEFDDGVASLISILGEVGMRSGRTPAPGTLQLVCDGAGRLASGDLRYVRVDGKKVGLLLTGTVPSEFAIPAGTHTVRVGRGLMWSEPVTVTLRPARVTLMTYKITSLGKISLR
jgi:hypothetical protein